MFGKGPESFNTIDVVSSFRYTFFFQYCNVIPANRKRSIGKPVIGIVEIPCFSISGDIGHHGLSDTWRDRKSKDFPISLVNAKDNDLAWCSPASLTRSLTAEHGFIHFDFSRERFKVFDHILVYAFSEHPKTSLDGQLAVKGPEISDDKQGRLDRNIRLIFLSNREKYASFSRYFSLFFWWGHTDYTWFDRWKVPTIFYCLSEGMFSYSLYTVLSTVFQSSKCNLSIVLPKKLGGD